MADRRRQQSQVPFDTYLRHRKSETESIPMGSSSTSDKSTSGPPPPAFSQQDPNPDRAGLAAPCPAPPPFTSRPPSPPKTGSSTPSRPSAIPQYVDTDGEGGITVTRACISVPGSRAASPPLRDSTPASSTSHVQVPQAPQSAPPQGGHDLSTGASALTTPALTSSSEASSPDLGAASGARIENRVAVAAEMAAPAPSDSESQSQPQSQQQAGEAMDEDEGPGSSLSTTAVVGTSAGPIETTAPGPDGPQLPFDEVVRLISSGRADEVPHTDIPEGLNQTPASVPQMSARPKPWERAAAAAVE